MGFEPFYGLAIFNKVLAFQISIVRFSDLRLGHYSSISLENWSKVIPVTCSRLRDGFRAILRTLGFPIKRQHLKIQKSTVPKI